MKYKFFKRNEIYESKSNQTLLFLYQTILGRFLLKIIYHKWVSNIVAFFLNLRISKPLITKYIKKYDIDMNLYKEKKYKSFNDFFIRDIKSIKKTQNNNDFISICDSKVMIYEIKKDLIIKIKNSEYSIKELIKDTPNKEYLEGYCIVYRLEPQNYHHYIFNDDGKIINNKKINGILHTVNPIVYDHYQVFTENKREVSILKTKHFGEMIQIEVGALCVGKIKNRIIKDFKRYNEKGYFEFGGSTIIQLIQKNKVLLDEEIIKNSKENIETQVSIGDVIGKKVEKKC